MLIGKQLHMYQRSKLPPPSDSCNQRRVALLPVTQPNHQKRNTQTCIKDKLVPWSSQQFLPTNHIPGYSVENMLLQWEMCQANKFHA